MISTAIRIRVALIASGLYTRLIGANVVKIARSSSLLESPHKDKGLQTMFQRHSGPRLPLKTALKAYWLWLLPLVLCSAVLFFVPNAAAHFLVVGLVFVVSAASAAWPWFRHDAPYSFWMVAVGLWLCTGLIFPVIAGLVAELWK